jgi:retron-type reverse transcriptase
MKWKINSRNYLFIIIYNKIRQYKYIIRGYLNKSGSILFALMKDAENKQISFCKAVNMYCNTRWSNNSRYFEHNQKTVGIIGYFKWLTLYKYRTPRIAVQQKEFINQKWNGVSIRLQQFKSFNTSGQKAKELLTNLKKNNDKKKLLINEKIIKLISNQSILLLAYKLIKNNNKKVDKYFNEEVLESINLGWLNNTSLLLEAGHYKFKLTTNFGESLQDQIVKKAIQIVLEPIFEATFKKNSHACRPLKGRLSALREIKKRFHKIFWVLKLSIQNCFESIYHEKLIKLIKQKINCEKTSELLLSFLKKNNESNKNIRLKGIPQCKFLSPLFCNIYLHELDNFIYSLKTGLEIPKINKRPNNFKFVRLNYLLNKIHCKLKNKKIVLEWKQKINNKPYVRYLNDFILGCAESYDKPANIQKKINNFLTNNLNQQLCEAKSIISQLNYKKINFLSTEIFETQEKKVVFKGIKNLLVQAYLQLRIEAPLIKILNKLYKMGLIKKNKSGIYKPTALKRIINQDHTNIINYYNAIAKSIINYYSFVHNFTKLEALVSFSIRHSLALTVALKYKLKYKSKAYKRFGDKLKSPDDSSIRFLF